LNRKVRDAPTEEGAIRFINPLQDEVAGETAKSLPGSKAEQTVGRKDSAGNRGARVMTPVRL